MLINCDYEDHEGYGGINFGYYSPHSVADRKDGKMNKWMGEDNLLYKDINFYYVNVSGITQGEKKRKEDSKVVRNLIERLKINSEEVLMDKYGLTAEKYDALTLPQLVIINSKGKIEYIHPRERLNVGKEISKVLNKLTK